MFLQPSHSHFHHQPSRRSALEVPSYLHKDVPAVFSRPSYLFQPSYPALSSTNCYSAPPPSPYDLDLGTLGAEARYRRAQEELLAAKQEYDALLHAQEEQRRREELERLREARMLEARQYEQAVRRALLERQQTEANRRASLEQKAEARREALVHELLAARSNRAQHHRRQQNSRPQDMKSLMDLLNHFMPRDTGAQAAAAEPQNTRGPAPAPEPVTTSAPKAPEPESTPQKRTESTQSEPQVKDIFEFLLDIFGPRAESKDGTAPNGKEEVAPAEGNSVAEKAKGKAKAEPEREALDEIIAQRLEDRLRDEREQELQDTVKAILNSLRDQGGPGTHASSSKTKMEDAPKSVASDGADLKRTAELSGNAAKEVQANFQGHRRTTSASDETSRRGVSDTAPKSPSTPVSPSTPATALSRISNIRTSFHALTSSFHFPTDLDFDALSGTLTFSPANAPVHAYEHALNGLLTQLDAVESDGDDDIREHRREVVREVEKALEEYENEIVKRRSVSLPVQLPAEAKAESEETETSSLPEPAHVEESSSISAPATPETPSEDTGALETDAHNAPGGSADSGTATAQEASSEVSNPAIAEGPEGFSVEDDSQDDAPTELPSDETFISDTSVLSSEVEAAPAVVGLPEDAGLEDEEQHADTGLIPIADNESPLAPAHSTTNLLTLEDSLSDRQTDADDRQPTPESSEGSVNLDAHGSLGDDPTSNTVIGNGGTEADSPNDSDSTLTIQAHTVSFEPSVSAPAGSPVDSLQSSPRQPPAAEPFLASLSHDQFEHSRIPDDTEVEELGDSILVDKDEDVDSELSWAEVEA